MSAPKIVPVSVWAAARYDPPPSDWVLRKWCRQGEIYPAPERVGKEWRCFENARRLTGVEPVGGGLLNQLNAA